MKPVLDIISGLCQDPEFRFDASRCPDRASVLAVMLRYLWRDFSDEVNNLPNWSDHPIEEQRLLNLGHAFRALLERWGRMRRGEVASANEREDQTITSVLESLSAAASAGQLDRVLAEAGLTPGNRALLKDTLGGFFGGVRQVDLGNFLKAQGETTAAEAEARERQRLLDKKAGQ